MTNFGTMRPKLIAKIIRMAMEPSAIVAPMNSHVLCELLMMRDAERLRGSLHLLIGFFVGCVAAAAAVTYLGDWAWSFPAVLAAVAVALG